MKGLCGSTPWGFLNRYNGYQFKSWRRDPTHPNYPAGAHLPYVFKDRSGYLWVSSNESLDRFDPGTETSGRSPIDGNVRAVSSGRSYTSARIGLGSCGWPRTAGLHRLDPTSG